MDANRAVRPQPGELQDSADSPEPDDEPAEQSDDEPAEQPETSQDAYDVFDPGGVQWRL